MPNEAAVETEVETSEVAEAPAAEEPKVEVEAKPEGEEKPEGEQTEEPAAEETEAKDEPPAEEPAVETEAPPEPAAEEPKPEEPSIKPEAYARLLRKSKTRREEIAKLQAEKVALEQRQKELEAQREAAELGKRINAAREAGDLTSLLDTLGLDVQGINEAFVKHEGKIPAAKQKPETIVEALVEKKLAEREAAAKAHHEASIARARAQSIERVAANPSAAVLVKLNYAGEVFDYQAAMYERTGRIPTEDEAIEHVVKFVRETVLGSESKPAAKSEPKPAAKAAPAKPVAKPAVRTLSSASAPSSAGVKKARTDAEIEAETIQFLNDFKAGRVRE